MLLLVHRLICAYKVILVTDGWLVSTFRQYRENVRPNLTHNMLSAISLIVVEAGSCYT